MNDSITTLLIDIKELRQLPVQCHLKDEKLLIFLNIHNSSSYILIHLNTFTYILLKLYKKLKMCSRCVWTFCVLSLIKFVLFREILKSKITYINFFAKGSHILGCERILQIIRDLELVWTIFYHLKGYIFVTNSTSHSKH